MSLNAISENKILVKISIIFMVQFLFKVILIGHMPRLALFLRRFLSDAPFAVKLIHMYVFTPPGSSLDGFVLFVFVALRPMSTARVIAGRSVHLTTLFGLFWDSGYEALEGGLSIPYPFNYFEKYTISLK